MVVGRRLTSDLRRALPVHLRDPVEAFHAHLVRAQHVRHRLKKVGSGHIDQVGLRYLGFGILTGDTCCELSMGGIESTDPTRGTVRGAFSPIHRSYVYVRLTDGTARI